MNTTTILIKLLLSPYVWFCAYVIVQMLISAIYAVYKHFKHKEMLINEQKEVAMYSLATCLVNAIAFAVMYRGGI